MSRCWHSILKRLELEWSSQLSVSAYGISEDPWGQKSKSSQITRVTII